MTAGKKRDGVGVEVTVMVTAEVGGIIKVNINAFGMVLSTNTVVVVSMTVKLLQHGVVKFTDQSMDF